MIYDYTLIQKTRCSDKEKKKCMDLIDKFVKLCEIARINGIIALEDNLGDEKNPIIRKGLQLIVDGTDPDYVSDILKNNIYLCGYSGRKLLEQFIIYDGILSIQNGTNPRYLKLRLFSYLGEYGNAMDYGPGRKEAEEYKDYLSDLQNDTSPGLKDNILDPLFSCIDDRGIQRLLREIDTHIFAMAVTGVSGKTKLRIYNNMSMYAGIILKEEIKNLWGIPEKMVMEAQVSIKNICAKLEDQAEIVVNREKE